MYFVMQNSRSLKEAFDLMAVACRVVYEQQVLSGQRNAGLVIDYEPIEDRVRSACRLGIGGG